MPETTQSELENLYDRVSKHELTPAQANVEKVRMQRVKLVTARIPAEVRKSLNQAVKDGLLAHKKRDGRKPEVYYHPNFDYLVEGERNAHARRKLEAVANVLAHATIEETP